MQDATIDARIVLDIVLDTLREVARSTLTCPCVDGGRLRSGEVPTEPSVRKAFLPTIT